MYYVLFTHIKVKKGKGFEKFRFEKEVIEFLRATYEDIEVDTIIETARSYRLGLVVTEELIKSVLEPEEEPESLVPLVKTPEEADKRLKEVLDEPEILKQNKEKLEETETEEPSAMETIADHIDEEIKEDKLTPEQGTKKSLDDADDVITREKKRQEQAAKGWELCTKCNSKRVAPWNKKQICSPCQRPEGKRPYIRKKEFLGPTEG